LCPTRTTPGMPVISPPLGEGICFCKVPTPVYTFRYQKKTPSGQVSPCFFWEWGFFFFDCGFLLGMYWGLAPTRVPQGCFVGWIFFQIRKNNPTNNLSVKHTIGFVSQKNPPLICSFFPFDERVASQTIVTPPSGLYLLCFIIFSVDQIGLIDDLFFTTLVLALSSPVFGVAWE